jgi:hypothetical protein
MSLPTGSTVNIVEFFVLPQTAQPTLRMTFDVSVPKTCDNAESEDTFSRRFQTDVVVAELADPVTEAQRDAALATGWDQVEATVLQWSSANSVCPVGKAFDPTAKALV